MRQVQPTALMSAIGIAGQLAANTTVTNSSITIQSLNDGTNSGSNTVTGIRTSANSVITQTGNTFNLSATGTTTNTTNNLVGP